MFLIKKKFRRNNYLLFTLFFLYSTIAVAQNNINVKIPRDTSYTLYSAAKKMHKKFPDAKLVRAKLPSDVKVVKNIVYKKIGKRELHLNIYYPSELKGKTYPAILTIFGGGWISGSISMIIPMTERLATKGFVTVAPEYRLSTEALYPAAVLDLKAALRWMHANSKKYHIDTNEIAAYGCSAGGQLAALIGTTNGDKKFEDGSGNNNYSSNVQAIVDVDGVVDFFGKGSKEVKKNPKKPGDARLWFGVSAKDNPKVWEDAGAYNHTSKNTPPICFINSAVPRFHAGRGEMIKLLKKYNIYYEVHTLPNTIHTFWLFRPWFEKTFNYTVNFLDKVFEKK